MNSLSSGSVPGNRFVFNQAFSSAQMVRQMVLDEMRRGDFSNLGTRISRIEELVRQGFLKREDERRLTLLAAQFLEAAGETKKALRMVGHLLADEDTLAEELFVELRRFRVRLLLNIGHVAAARTEVERIERVVLSTEGTFGASVEAVDGDNSRVSVATWLLTAEVCVSEGKHVEGMAALRSAFETMKRDGQAIEDGVMFELLSALVCYQAGDDGGIPALAYLYRVHVVLESSVDASIRARIAAAAGDLHRVAGLSGAEAARWREYGPDRALVARYLGEGEGVVPPSDLLTRILPSESISADAVGEVTKVVRRAELGGGTPGASFAVPMSFQFDAFGIEEITSMFDFNMKTGPLVIDWSACGKDVLEEAIAAGAISAQARICERGTIYFNNGSYVDARFEENANGDSGPAVLETIFEIFRISMARLPGAYGYHAASGSLAARAPEIVNLRPNNVNIDLMKKLDHLRSGIEEIEDENIDRLFDQWQEPVDASEPLVEDTAISAGVKDVAVGMDLGLVSKFGAIMGAREVAQVDTAAAEALALLGFENPRLEFVVAGAERPLTESKDGNDRWVVAEQCVSGALTARLLLAEAGAVNCPEAVRAVLKASAQRLRTVSGRAFEGRIQVSEFVAADPVTQSLLSTLRDFAVLDGTAGSRLKHICLVGERGVGKEILARLIHNWSGRAQEPFVAVNFGAVSKELAAAEVFGARKGSYSGSVADRRGYIQQAEGGTLFLDELDEATDSVQALIKRAVEYGVFNVVGDASESKANIRYVAATNIVDIESLRIKRDLKDRFLPLRVPPLRERRGDIRPLAEKFAAEYDISLPEPVMVFLEQLDWPGNVRQLRNVIERSCAVSSGPLDLTLDLVQRSATEDGAIVAVSSGTGIDFVPLRNGETLEMRVDEVEKRHILATLELCNGNKTHAAQVLGMTRQSLLTRIKKSGL